MKKLLLPFCLIIIGFSLNAQDTKFDELISIRSFSDYMPTDTMINGIKMMSFSLKGRNQGSVIMRLKLGSKDEVLSSLPSDRESLIQTYKQIITGKVLSASNNEPLIYASIGVIETSFGTITNEEGDFNLDIKGLPVNSQVRFSMIGFRSRTFTIEELLDKDNILRLENEIYKLPDVIVNPSGKLRKVGTKNYTYKGGVCGWGGTDFSKGYEIGTKLELGDRAVRLKSLNMHLFKQSFDSSLFRLHIRNIIDSLPGSELLNTNIFITITKESGWIEVDLSKYNLVLEGDIVLSLEWIKVIGLNKENLLRINGQKQYLANILFNLKINHGSMFTRWGTEARWVRHERRSPSFYLTAQ